MTTEKTTITITMSDRAPIKIVGTDWPVIARANWFSGQHESQANETAKVVVREHADGRRIAYSARGRGPGGMPIGYRDTAGGYLVDAEDPADTICAIRLAAVMIKMAYLGDECIGNLPAQELT